MLVDHSMIFLFCLCVECDCSLNTFNWLNKYRSAKSMNEAHFMFFLLYVADLHNLKIEQKLRVMCRPKVLGAEKANLARQQALASVKVCF